MASNSAQLTHEEKQSIKEELRVLWSIYNLIINDARAQGRVDIKLFKDLQDDTSRAIALVDKVQVR